MTKVLAYTSPARGHLFPLVPILLELQREGAEVHLRTIAGEVERVRATGIDAEAIDPRIEAIEMDDWRESSVRKANQRSVGVWIGRARHDRGDLQAAIDATDPDYLLIDTSCFGAAAVAEASGLPWGVFMPYFAPLPGPGVPAFGPGMKPGSGPLIALRDRLLWKLVETGMTKALLGELNPLRQQVGAAPLESAFELWTRAPRTFYLTVPELEYPRQWPDSYRFVGPTAWEPESEPPAWLAAIDRPLVLVSISTEQQDDSALIQAALDGLADSDAFVVATSGAWDPAQFNVPANARVERYLPHTPLLERADCVICHGGMGITQKALTHGVPPVVAGFGRDQLEVARRVEHAGAGVAFPVKKLSAKRVREAVSAARERRPGAERIAAAIAAAPGAAGVAEEIAATDAPVAQPAA